MLQVYLYNRKGGFYMSAKIWNERYEREEYVYGTEPNNFLEKSVHHFPKKGRVLCLAEGEGRNALFLTKNGYHVCATDISTAGQKKAKKLAQSHGLSFEYIVADINDFDIGENQWDMIVSIYAHTSSETRHKTLQKILTGLKNGGIFLLEAYHPNQLTQKYETGGPNDIDWLVSLDELTLHFSGHEILVQNETERYVSEGIFHTGKAFITQFICKKASD